MNDKLLRAMGGQGEAKGVAMEQFVAYFDLKLPRGEALPRFCGGGVGGCQSSGEMQEALCRYWLMVGG
jgi:hypothetical protein